MLSGPDLSYNRLLDKLRGADGVAHERLRRVLINAQLSGLWAKRNLPLDQSTVIAAWRALILRRPAMPKPSARSVNDCFKKWAPDFEMTEYCFRNQSIAYRQL